MHTDERRTRQVLAVVRDIAARQDDFSPADVLSRLRELGQPLGAWEVRGELQRLRSRGAVDFAAGSARWQLSAASADAAASA